jgi:hypothetical protein
LKSGAIHRLALDDKRAFANTLRCRQNWEGAKAPFKFRGRHGDENLDGFKNEGLFAGRCVGVCDSG